MSTVLLPTDFSDNAKHASRFALQLFGKDPARKFILLHTYHIPYPATDITFQGASETLVSLSESLKEESEAALLKEKEALADAFNEYAVSSEMCAEHGDLVHVVEKMQKNNRCDGIVMGTKGASGLKELLIGSNAASIMRHVKCPVLIVPENAEIKPPERITFAADFKAIENKKSLDVLKEIAETFDAEVLILNVLQNGDAIPFEEADEALVLHNFLGDKINHDFYTAKNTRVDKGIEEFIHGNNTDLLVMTTREHSFLHRIFNPSITKKVALHTDIPILILHEK